MAERQYRVVMPDFLARGGDGLGSVVSTLPAARIDLGDKRTLNFRDALVSFWQKRKEPLASPRSGRTAFVDSQRPCAEDLKPQTNLP